MQNLLVYSRVANSFQLTEECPVCLETLSQGVVLGHKNGREQQDHKIHEICLKATLTQSPNPACPECRGGINPRDILSLKDRFVCELNLLEVPATRGAFIGVIISFLSRVAFSINILIIMLLLKGPALAVGSIVPSIQFIAIGIIGGAIGGAIGAGMASLVTGLKDGTIEDRDNSAKKYGFGGFGVTQLAELVFGFQGIVFAAIGMIGVGIAVVGANEIQRNISLYRHSTLVEV